MNQVFRFALASAVLAALLYAAYFGSMALSIGAGYAAKQLCSGRFVARLPLDFVADTDVIPRLATLGPLAELLRYEVNATEKTASASLLGQRRSAQYRAGYGCTLSPAGTDHQTSPLTAPDSAQPAAASTLFMIETLPHLTPAIDHAFTEPPEGGRHTLAVVVMHRGDIVAERYAAPVTARTPMQGWSMNKSLMATFVGRQIDAGLLRLEDSVPAALLAADMDSQDLKSVDPSLTLRHLLSMTTGFDFSERYFPGDDVTDMLYRQPAMWQSAPKAGHAHSPGTRFAYSSGDINTASLMWHQSLNGQPYIDWIDEAFSAPIGLEKIVLEPDTSGVQVGSSYAYLTARDWARFGQLWLDAWHGRSNLISQAWQRLAVTPGTADRGEIYGLGFWLNTEHRAFPSAPETTFHAGGNSGQFVVVIPEQELVVVRLGLTLEESRAEMDNLLADVLAALESPE